MCLYQARQTVWQLACKAMLANGAFTLTAACLCRRTLSRPAYVPFIYDCKELVALEAFLRHKAGAENINGDN